MAKIAKKLTELIGHTPLMELSGYSRKYGLQENIVAKLESFNPAGSVKDRVALSMIEDAEERGVLQPGCHYHRAYQWLIPVWGLAYGGHYQRVSPYTDHARNHEPGTP